MDATTPTNIRQPKEAPTVEGIVFEARCLRDEHTPTNVYNRCEHCNYARHPCDMYRLTDDVIRLLDPGKD